ncbi:MAG: hypothetical protein JO291_00575 [Acidimicrobiia bacterium]|nr:hypothetical protein [Acidimicrobiia bacterium]
MTARRLAVLVVAAALLAACHSGSGDGADPPSSTTSTTAAKTTTSSATTRTTTTAKPGAGPTQGFASAKAAIDHFVAAWQAGDEAGAQVGASAIAVHNVFTQPGPGFALYGCDTGEFATSTCNYRNRATNGYASITAEKAPIGWIVTEVYMTIDN